MINKCLRLRLIIRVLLIRRYLLLITFKLKFIVIRILLLFCRKRKERRSRI